LSYNTLLRDTPHLTTGGSHVGGKTAAVALNHGNIGTQLTGKRVDLHVSLSTVPPRVGYNNTR
jgi:hypothetical protein